MNNVLITGGTGFLGKYIIQSLIPHVDNIFILTRQNPADCFEEHFWKDSKIQFIHADLSSNNIFENLEMETKNQILNSVDTIIYAAALYDLKANFKDSYLNNVVGLRNFLSKVHEFKKIKKILYVSTIAVAGQNEVLLENTPQSVNTKFDDHYSKTKYLAEVFFRESKLSANIKKIIVRPGIIVGDSATGKMDKIDGPYYFIEAIKKLQKSMRYFPYIPLSYNPKSLLPIIPVDNCANLIVESLMVEKTEDDVTLHLISDQIPSIQEFLDDLCKHFKIKSQFVPTKRNILFDSVFNSLGIPTEVIPFMFSEIKYDKFITNQVLPKILKSRYDLFKNQLFKDL